jgi:biopolymer transport protein ExbB
MKKQISISAILSAAALSAQEAIDAAAESSITIQTIITNGGWVMYVIAVLSIAAVTLALFYAFTLREKILCPKKFLRSAAEAAETGNAAAIRNLCQQSASPAARIVEAAVAEIPQDGPMDAARVRDAMEEEGARQSAALWQRLQFLMDIAVISPMVGLLGTVWGLMVSFGGINNGADFAKKAEMMASGISQAIYTTFGGLVVGIVAMVLHNLFRAKLTKLIGILEANCAAILKALTARKEARR